MSDRDGEDDLARDVPRIDPAAEAEVRALLAALPDPPMPDDVLARVEAALAAERGATGPGAGGAGTASTTRAPWYRRGPTRAAAAVVLVAALAGAAVGVLADGEGAGVDPDGRYRTDPAGVSALEATVSNHAYTTDRLARDVRTIVRDGGLPAGGSGGDVDALTDGSAADPDSADESTVDAEPRAEAEENLSFSFSGPPGNGAAAEGAATPGSGPAPDGTVEDVAALVRDDERRAACVAELSGRDDVAPLAVDAGTFEGRPAALIVLPLAEAPDQVEVWVVGATCSPADDPFPLHYRDVTLR